MIPAAFVTLPALPLTPNGKTDRKALLGHDTTAALDEQVPPRDATERRLRTLWEELLGISPIGVTADFFELGGDSLLAFALRSRCEREFGVTLRIADILEGRTIAQLAARLRAGATPPHAPALVTLRAGAPGVAAAGALVCVHGAMGGVGSFLELAAALAPDRAVHALHAEGGPEGPTLEAQAARYVAELRAAGHQAPHHLLGWSSGGVVAFEMARQLQAAGEAVATLALLDSHVPGALILSPGVEEGALVERALAALGGERLPPEERARLAAAHRRTAALLRGHRPGRYRGRVLLFVARDAAAPVDPAPWRALVEGDVEVIEVEGDHFRIVAGAAVRQVAARLDAGG
jgi:thioesterase domain-containing protein/acyl carrier protein